MSQDMEEDSQALCTNSETDLIDESVIFLTSLIPIFF
jgi:hypothetical protein